MLNLATAVTPEATTGSSAIYSIGWLVIMGAIFYFLLIRPQSKRNKKRNVLLNSLKVNDKIVTIGGIHGTIVEMTDDIVSLRVSDNSVLTLDRSSINSVVEE